MVLQSGRGTPRLPKRIKACPRQRRVTGAPDDGPASVPGALRAVIRGSQSALGGVPVLLAGEERTW